MIELINSLYWFEIITIILLGIVLMLMMIKR